MPKNVSKINYIYAFIWLFVLTISIYGRAVEFGFFGEDFVLAKPLSEYKFFTSPDTSNLYWRPMWLFWFSLEYELFNMNASLYHAMQLILHFINLILAFTLFVRVGIPVLVGIFSVSMWSVLAGNAVPITWFSQSSDLLSMMFLLIAFHLWLYFLKSDFSNLLTAILSAIAWLFSMASKEMGFLFPFVCILSSLFWNRFYRNRVKKIPSTAFIVPLAFFLLYIISKIIYHRGVGEFVPTTEGRTDTLIVNLPLYIQLLSRIIHYCEGLFYLLVPLDLANSTKAIFISLFLTVGMLVQLFIIIKGQWRTNTGAIFLSGAVISAMFSVHAIVNPHPRTLYVATLWISLAVCSVYSSVIKRNFTKGNIEEKQSLLKAVSYSLPCLIFFPFIVMHIYLGQLVVESYSPRSDSILIDYVQKLSRPDLNLSPEKTEYIQKELSLINIEKIDINTPTYGTRGPWRTFLRGMYQKYVKR